MLEILQKGISREYEAAFTKKEEEGRRRKKTTCREISWKTLTRFTTFEPRLLTSFAMDIPAWRFRFLDPFPALDISKFSDAFRRPNSCSWYPNCLLEPVASFPFSKFNAKPSKNGSLFLVESYCSNFLISFSYLHPLEHIPSSFTESQTLRFFVVVLQFPDSLLKVSVSVSSALRLELKKQGEQCDSVKLYILADTTFGSCCGDEIAAAHVNAECIIHYGHTCLTQWESLLILIKDWYPDLVDSSAEISVFLYSVSVLSNHIN